MFQKIKVQWNGILSECLVFYIKSTSLQPILNISFLLMAIYNIHKYSLPLVDVKMIEMLKKWLYNPIIETITIGYVKQTLENIIIIPHHHIRHPLLLYAKQKHPGCKKRRGQSEAAVIK